MGESVVLWDTLKKQCGVIPGVHCMARRADEELLRWESQLFYRIL